jgi:hypothetical protein
MSDRVSVQTFGYVLMLALATPTADLGRAPLVDEAASALARAFRAEIGSGKRRDGASSREC